MSALAEAMFKAGLNKEKAEEIIERDRKKDRKKEKEQSDLYSTRTLDDLCEEVLSSHYN